MRQIRELLRLKFGEDRAVSDRAIALHLGFARSTVQDYLARIAKAGLNWPLPEDFTDAVLAGAIEIFAAAGARIVPVKPVLSRRILDCTDRFWRARAWNELRLLSEERRAELLPYIHDWARAGEAVTGWQAVDGFDRPADRRAALRRSRGLAAGPLVRAGGGADHRLAGAAALARP